MSQPTTLGGLVRRHGISAVAEVLGISKTSLPAKRSGAVGLSVDELCRLIMAYGSPRYPHPDGRREFDIEATILDIGERRLRRQKQADPVPD